MNSESRFQEFLAHHAYLKGIEKLSINFGPVKSPKDHPLEQVFYSNLFKILTNWDRFNEFNWFIIGVYQPYDFTFDERSIVFCLSNETHEIPEDIQKAGWVFSPYSPTDHSIKNSYAIPLGYNGSLCDLPLKSINERKYDVFFSGNIYKKRLNFYAGARIYQLFNKMRALFGKKSFSDHLQFNRKFTGGMSPLEYSNVLMNTKVALVPEGYLSDVSFRFFEAAKMGCIVVTKELYDFWFFKKFPGKEMKSWIGLSRTLKSMLKDPDMLAHMQKEMLAYYDAFCSEEATAKYVKEIILK